MMRSGWVAAGVAAACLLAGAAAWWWWASRVPAPIAVAPPAGGTIAPATSANPPLVPAAVEIAASEPVGTEPPLQAEGVGPALAQLLGTKTARQWLRTDDFARRFVTTVDNLGREHAPAMAWPVEPTGGRFTVLEHQGRTIIDPDNALRYTPLVRLLEGIDSAAAVSLYLRLMPLLQPAYEDLGFPRRRFHTRLLAVIDHLLAAPQAPEWIEVRLTEVRGPIVPLRPWVRYEFADPTLESASAGHKIMVRIGAANQHRLKSKLRELRAELLRRP